MFSTAGPRLRIQSHPLPLTEEEALQLDTVLSVLAAIMLLVPLCYLSGEAQASLPARTSRVRSAIVSGCQEHTQLCVWCGARI